MCNRYGQEKDSPYRIYLKISSTLMFIPAMISLYTQPMIISFVLFMASIFSTLYHMSDECNHATSDEIWASLTLMILLVMTLRLAAELGMFHWRVLLAFVFGVTAITAYMTKGSRNDTTETSIEYEKWHSIWHTFAAAAATVIVLQKSKITFRSDTLMKDTYQKSRENIESMIQIKNQK
jgi:hypothetical protein